MSYRKVRDFLASHTDVVELTDDAGSRVAVCPEWQGRVMTSTCSGDDGPSFGFVNRAFIEAKRPDVRFNNFGAEDRLWLSPEGGPFGLWFQPGAEQTLENWYTPPALNEGPFPITSAPEAACCQMARQMEFQNASATEFALEVSREVRLQSDRDLAEAFGSAAAQVVTGQAVKRVGYETVNTITNRAGPMREETGLLSLWILGMFNASADSVIIMPYRPGNPTRIGPPVKSDYFGTISPERLKILPKTILFTADGKYRSKIGTSGHRVRNVLGSIDFARNRLTLVHFSLPDEPARHPYMNNMWGRHQAEPYRGDAANCYNDGPPEPGESALGAFYEMESLSPAAALGTGESLTHRHRTLHVAAPPEVLDRLARLTLGIDWETVRREMFP